ncbi:uncharacterized protein KY384_007318 [Bacidia gigantensis]|uniref:uncharacterized protein n=1 Tax=Bacidia gigantensis TaxID=2732470 RepID=UPI001D053FF6|nr:uncharacterized protein KY384_007318 [Bacidia gigantensis]KAG8528400.1 hypothetical protein KY384_007318 [Bacidia gigantensis]
MRNSRASAQHYAYGTVAQRQFLISVAWPTKLVMIRPAEASIRDSPTNKNLSRSQEVQRLSMMQFHEEALQSLQILCLDLSDIKTFTTQFTEDGKDVSVTVNVTAQTIVTKAGLALSGVTDYDGDVDTDALNLINFNGCRAWQPPIIYSGWYQAYKIMNQNKDGVTDWLHVRCDDPDKKCPCPDGSETYALTVNKDKDSGIARINFCPAYFTMPTLNQALLHGKTNPPELALDLTQYSKNQDWVSKARSYGSNQHITDMNLRFQDIGGQAWESKAYNPLKAKILARYPYRTGECERTPLTLLMQLTSNSSADVWQNADNMNMYGLAKYVQKQLGNVYPAFPAVTEENLRAPWKDVVRTQDDGKDVKWNSSNPVFKALDARSGDGVSGCNDDLDGAQVVLTMSALMPDTSYPAAYQSQLKAWASSQGTYVPPASITSTVERAQTPTGLWPACLLTAS